MGVDLQPSLFTYSTRQYLFIFRCVRELRKATISFVLSVSPSVRPFIRMEQLGSTGRIFLKFGTSVLFETLSGKFKIHCNLTKITRTSREDRHTFLITSRSFLLRKSNISNKSFTKIQNTHFNFNNFFSNIVPFVRKCGKYCTVRQATNDNITHAHCMLDN
jgi:hypothetical protein